MNWTVVIIVILVCWIIFGKYIKNAIPTTTANNTVVRDSIIYFLVYALLLGIIYLKLPSLWISWTTPMMFFILTNLALIGAILLYAIVKTPGWSAFVAITVIIFILFNWIQYGIQHGNNSHTNSPKLDNNKYVPKKDSVVEKNGRGTTPCDLTFDYKFRIITSGPVYEKFPGIPNTIYYDGLNDNPVGNRYAGPVHFESADPNNPHINITVWHLLY